MKKNLLIPLIFLSGVAMAEETSSVTKTTKSVVSGIVSFGKNLSSGINDGIDEGRTSAQSTDNAILVNSHQSLQDYLTIKIIEITQSDKERSYIEVGFKNSNDRPVRVMNLAVAQNIIALDNDGYAINPVALKNPVEVTVPAKAGKKQRFYFAALPNSIHSIRIFGNVIGR